MANFEVEQNGTSGTANILTSAVAIGGQLYSGVDKDIFKITTTKATTLELSFTSPDVNVDNQFVDPLASDHYFNIRVFSLTNGVETELGQYGVDADFYALVNAPTIGDYYFQISAAKYYEDGQYQLVVNTGDKFAETEVNNSFDAANIAPAGKSITGQLKSLNDQDFFSFTFANAGLASVAFDSPKTTEDTLLRYDAFEISVYDVNRNLVSVHTTDTGIGNFDFAVPEAGQYYVSVSVPKDTIQMYSSLIVWDVWDSRDYHLFVTSSGDALTAVTTTNEDTPLVLTTASLIGSGTITSVQGAVNGVVTLAANNITFTPAPDFFGSAGFTYTTLGLDNQISTTSVVLNVLPVNDVPVAVGETVTTRQSTPLILVAETLLSNDTGLGDAPMTITSVQDAVGGRVSLLADNIIFTPDNNFIGAASFTYTITDRDKEVSTATVDVTVTSADEVVMGKDGNDHLIGGIGNDLLDGRLGKDVMIGGIGNDTYYIDNKGDNVVEIDGEGADTVISNIDISALMSNVENLILAEGLDLNGKALVKKGVGNASDNLIIGNASDNKLSGLDGDDTLDGGIGADSMAGGDGDDTYVVDNIKDKIVESANRGNDTLSAKIDILKLATNVENITLIDFTIEANGYGGTAHGNNGDNTLTGNSGSNFLDGHGGDDTLFGDKGNDDLHGGLGNDVLNGGAGNDAFVFETKLSELDNLDVIDDFHVSSDPDPDKIILYKSIFSKLGKSALSSENFYGYSGVPSQQGENAYILFDTSTGILYYDADGGLVSGVPIAFVAVGVVGLTAADIVVV